MWWIKSNDDKTLSVNKLIKSLICYVLNKYGVCRVLLDVTFAYIIECHVYMANIPMVALDRVSGFLVVGQSEKAFEIA